jgi:hypothetical protein
MTTAHVALTIFEIVERIAAVPFDEIVVISRFIQHTRRAPICTNLRALFFQKAAS